MKTRALQYYMHDGPGAFRFELAGDLDRQGASRLDQDWRTASSTLGDRRLVVDMTFLTSVDEAGRALLVGWHRGGAHIVANRENARALAASILGEPLRELPADTHAAAASNRTWIAFRTSVLGTLLLVFVALAFATEISGASLKSETVEAWNFCRKPGCGFIACLALGLRDPGGCESTATAGCGTTSL
jgi:ABC-type transporter Mla MlaB component